MENRKEYEQKAQAKFDQLDAEIKKLKAKLDEADADAQIELNKKLKS